MLCTGKLVRNKPMYRPEFEYLASIVKPEEVKNVKITLAAPEFVSSSPPPLIDAASARRTKLTVVSCADGTTSVTETTPSTRRSTPPRTPTSMLSLPPTARSLLICMQLAAATANLTIPQVLASIELAVVPRLTLFSCRFDEQLLAYFCATSMLDGMKEEGIDSAALLDKYIKLYNDCIRDAPADMTIGLHLCRGNFKDGMHFSEGGYEHISKKLFNECNVSVYYLEYDTVRAGGFEVRFFALFLFSLSVFDRDSAYSPSSTSPPTRSSFLVSSPRSSLSSRTRRLSSPASTRPRTSSPRVPTRPARRLSSVSASPPSAVSPRTLRVTPSTSTMCVLPFAPSPDFFLVSSPLLTHTDHASPCL
jgi:hypothetical protein